jgi:hypothetical protein
MEILSRELKIPFKQITKRGDDTHLLVGKTKDFIARDLSRGDIRE